MTVPRTANDTLISMSSAIVRNIIANSTIDHVIKNRAALRAAISNEITPVVKGWGIWIEAVEITDVKICSGTLFKNMQAKFRETNRKTATIQQLTNQYEIDDEQREYSFEKYKQDVDNAREKRIVRQRIEVQDKERELKNYEKKVEFSKLQTKREHEQKIFEADQSQEEKAASRTRWIHEQSD